MTGRDIQMAKGRLLFCGAGNILGLSADARRLNSHQLVPLPQGCHVAIRQAWGHPHTNIVRPRRRMQACDVFLRLVRKYVRQPPPEPELTVRIPGAREN